VEGVVEMSSARQGWQGTVKVPVKERESPNHQVPYVSAHIRVYWPGNATEAQILDAIDAAWWEAVQGVQAQRHPKVVLE
jgi:hypothetical protein